MAFSFKGNIFKIHFFSFELYFYENNSTIFFAKLNCTVKFKRGVDIPWNVILCYVIRKDYRRY